MYWCPIQVVFNLNQVWTWPTKWQWQKSYNLLARNLLLISVLICDHGLRGWWSLQVHDGQHSQSRLLSFLIGQSEYYKYNFSCIDPWGVVCSGPNISQQMLYMALWQYGIAEYQEKRTHFNWNKITFFTSKMLRKILLYPFKKLGRSLGSSKKSDSYYDMFLDAVLGTLNFSFPSWSLRKEYPFLFLTSKVENLFF